MIDLAPIRPEIEASLPLFRCGGCQLELARKAGAGYALNVIVRKVSTLVQEIPLILADVERDDVVAFHSVSIRNNSDDAWRRGLLYNLEHRLPDPTEGSKRPRHEGVGSDRDPGGALAWRKSSGPRDAAQKPSGGPTERAPASHGRSAAPRGRNVTVRVAVGHPSL